MRRLITIFFLAVALGAEAKDLHTLVVKATMHCENCTKRIRERVRFVRGVKSIKADWQTGLVTVVYDADKGEAVPIVKAIADLGYDATVVSDRRVEEAVQPVQKPVRK